MDLIKRHKSLLTNMINNPFIIYNYLMEYYLFYLFYIFSLNSLNTFHYFV